MIIKRVKQFSMLFDQVNSEYNNTPENISDFPKIIQNYYKTGLNKLYFELIKLQDVFDINPFPVPVMNDFVTDNGYIAVFAKNQDDADTGRYSIYSDNKGNLYKKSGLFVKSYKKISEDDFKDFLMSSLEDDDFGEEWAPHPNYKKISSIEIKIRDIIDKRL